MESNLKMRGIEGASKPKRWRRLGWLLAVGVLISILFVFFPSAVDPRCGSLLARSDEVSISLPSNCIETLDAPAGDTTRSLDRERNQRGLILKSWIICKPSTAVPNPSLLFDQDPRWLPSYVPGTYQFRRTVVVVSRARPALEGTTVVGAVCLVPWHRYGSQISGECGGKFAVWK